MSVCSTLNLLLQVGDLNIFQIKLRLEFGEELRIDGIFDDRVLKINLSHNLILLETKIECKQVSKFILRDVVSNVRTIFDDCLVQHLIVL